MSDAPAFYSTALEGGRASVWLGDCLEAMGHMDADSVDQVITDPPYEKHMHVNKAQKAHPRGRKIRGDGYAELEVLDFASIEPIRVEAARQMVRVSRGWLLVFCTPEGVGQKCLPPPGAAAVMPIGTPGASAASTPSTPTMPSATGDTRLKSRWI